MDEEPRGGVWRGVIIRVLLCLVASGLVFLVLRWMQLRDAKATLEGRVVAYDTGETITTFDVGVKQGLRSGGSMWDTGYRTRKGEAFTPGAPTFMHILDGGGCFILENVEPGEATIFVRAPVYGCGFLEVLNVRAGERREGLTVKLGESRVVEGVVTDSGGAPLAGASILLGALSGTHSREDNAICDSVAVSEADGYFRVAGVPEDVTIISAYYPSLAPAWAELDPESARATVRLELAPPCRLEGTVRLGKRHVANCAQQVFWDDSSGSTIFASAGTQDRLRRFKFEELPRGEATLYSLLTGEGGANPSRHAVVARVQLVGGETLTRDVRFGDGAYPVTIAVTLEGRVPGHTTKCVLAVVGADGAEFFMESGTLDGEGVVSFFSPITGMATAIVDVVAQDGSMQHRTRAAPLTESESLNLAIDIRSSEACTIEGNLAGLAGREVAEATVTVGNCGAYGGSMVRWLSPFEIGPGHVMVKRDSLVVRGVGPGTYTVVVRARRQKDNNASVRWYTGMASKEITITSAGEKAQVELAF